MKNLHWRRLLTSVVLCLVLFVSGCQNTPSPYDQVQQESTQRNAPVAVAKDATQGSQFNQFFPTDQGGFKRVYTQEKKGFSEAKLKKNGTVMAMLAISDTSSLPGAAAKYDNATEKLASYPTVEVGNTQTGILVADRYQVKVISRDPSFTQQDRQDWIQKFDLAGLSKLK